MTRARGGAAILLLLGVLLAAAAALALGRAGSTLALRARADTVAEVAVAAAADARVAGRATPEACERATRLAARDGARLTRCSEVDDRLVVEVRIGAAPGRAVAAFER